MTHGKSLIGSCLRKSSYRTEAKANTYKAKAEAARPDTKLRVYYCGLCQGYHLTKAPLPCK